MQMVQKLKQFEKQMVYLKWAGGESYGKINYVGSDFVEFEALDTDTMEYVEKTLINAQMLLEVVINSSDISRVLVEYSAQLPHADNELN
ncbi:MAG: hypothetical protein PHV37_07185 [Candidatus Gastranaerophilales bacterium]|nr:hypothetical protein [Candidatus Gastranaerophilales bacterium]